MIESLFFANNVPLPRWNEYNDILEGFILENNTEEKEDEDMIVNADDHIDSYFEVTTEYTELSVILRAMLREDDIMVCKGVAGFCSIPVTYACE
jgi:hypothetical protein